MTYDRLICPWCGAMVPERQARGIVHEWTGGHNAFDVCLNCARQSSPACPSHVHGIHGEVIDSDSSYWKSELIPASMKAAIPKYQQGHCFNCKMPMFWNVALQRWEGWKEPQLT